MVAATQTAAEGAIPHFPVVVITGEGWGRGWRMNHSMCPGVVLPPGITKITFNTRVAPYGEKPVTATGAFYISVGEDAPPEREISFVDDDNNPVPPPEWRFQMPTSFRLDIESEADNALYLRRLIRDAEVAREEAVGLCAPAVSKRAREGNRSLAHMPSTTVDDLEQVTWGVVFRGIDLYAGPQRPEAGFGHWIYLESRKAIHRTLAKASGDSEAVRDIRAAFARLKAAGEDVASAESVHRLLTLELLIRKELEANPSLPPEGAKARALTKLECREKYALQFEAELRIRNEWLDQLGSMPRPQFHREVDPLIAKFNGPKSGVRAEIVGWLYARVEEDIELILDSLNLCTPKDPQLPYSVELVRHAIARVGDDSVDAMRESGRDFSAAADPFEQVELAHYLETSFSNFCLTPVEQLVFLVRTNVLSDGSEESWTEVARTLGLRFDSDGRPSWRHVSRSLTTVIQSAREKLAGENPTASTGKSEQVLLRAADENSPLARAESSVKILLRNPTAKMS